MNRKRRGRPPSSTSVWDVLFPTLDLHGATADEATRRTERWLVEQQRAGVRTVRVITGKGLHSIGPPVLPGEIAALLGSLRSTMVQNFDTEPGGGVFRIELRKPSAPPAPAPPSAASPRPIPRVDPELRRRAEDALWELGVQPTPELIAIEIRRLLQRGSGEGS